MKEKLTRYEMDVMKVDTLATSNENRHEYAVLPAGKSKLVFQNAIFINDNESSKEIISLTGSLKNL